MTKQFDQMKPVRERDSEIFEVRVFCYDGGGERPIVGLFRRRDRVDGEWMCARWYSDGRVDRDELNGLDLVNVPEKKALAFYVNIAPRLDGTLAALGPFSDRKSADAYAPSNRFACIEITREVEEGEGL